MSIQAMVWVWDHSQTDGPARLVLLALADNANDEGLCWPSLATIARKTHISERSVRRHIRDIETLGELTVGIGGGRFASRYQFTYPGQSDRGTPVNLTPHPGQTDPPPRTTVSGEPKENPKRTSKNVREDRERTIEAWLRSDRDVSWQTEQAIPDAFARTQTDLWKGWLTGPTPAAKRTVDFSRSWRNWVLRAWTDMTEYRRQDWWKVERGETA